MDFGAEPSKGNQRLNTPDDAQKSTQTGYKRFHRRGKNRAAPDVGMTVTTAVAVPVPTPAKSESVPALPDPVQLPTPVILSPSDGPAEIWAALRQVTSGVRQNDPGKMPLVSFHRDDPASKAFDQLRTRLLQTLRANGWNRIAIASPTPGCGATFTVVNLGLSLARIPGSRTVLMDMNMRTPGVARALDVQCTGDMRGYLSGRIETEKHLVRVKDTLALGLAGQADRDAAELMHDPRTGAALDAMQDELAPDVVLYDLPPILAYDDLAAFLPQVDGVLLVADGTKTVAAHIEACEAVLDGQTKVLGVILNQARASGLQSFDA